MIRVIPALSLVAMLAAHAASAQTAAPVDTTSAPTPAETPVDTTLVPTPAETPVDPGAAVARVVQLEAARRSAMVAGDFNALAGVVAANATYVHSNGLLQNRDALFAMLERGDIRYVSFKTETVEYRAYGDTVVGTGVQSIDLTNGGKPFVSRSRFTVVYGPADGDIRLLAYQSTTMPELVFQEKK